MNFESNSNYSETSEEDKAFFKVRKTNINIHNENH